MPSKLPVFHSALVALRDLAAAVKALPIEFALVVSVLFLNAALSLTFFGQPTAAVPSLKMILLGLVSGAVTGLATAPLAVMIHRRIILSENVSLQSLPALRRQVVEFYVVSVLLSTAFSAAALVGMLVTSNKPNFLSLMLLVVLFLSGFYIMMRLFLLFPAIAVDDPDKSVAMAFRRAKGLVRRSFLVALLVILPAMAISGSVEALTKAVSPAGFVFGLFAKAIIDTAVLIAAVAIASRFYLWRQQNDDTPTLPQVSDPHAA